MPGQGLPPDGRIWQRLSARGAQVCHDKQEMQLDVPRYFPRKPATPRNAPACPYRAPLGQSTSRSVCIRMTKSKAIEKFFT